MVTHRRFLLVVWVSVLAALALVGFASHDGTGTALAAESPEPPRLVTAPAEEIGTSTARLVGSINPHGSATTYYFAWGTSYYSLPNRTPELPAGEGTHSTLFYEVLSGLEAGREYFFQLVATNAGGTSKGSIGHLVTLGDATPPTLELSGPAASGEIEEGEGSYELHIVASDGSSSAPQSGVTSIVVSVDGTVAQEYRQSCPAGDCGMEETWLYVPEDHPGHTNVVTVTATDAAGNVTTRSVTEVPPAERLQTCGEAGAASSPLFSSPTSMSVHALPGGGTARTMALGEGTEVEFPVPPSGFDPSTASAAELEEYGFPPRPTEAEALAEWEEDMAGFREVPSGSEEICRSETETETDPGESEAGTAEEEEGSVTYFSPKWAGFVGVDFAHPSRFVAITGDYVQPDTHPDSCSPSSEVSWIGLGGYGEAHGLIQAGTGITAENEFYGWFEWLGPHKTGINIHHIKKLMGHVHAGDAIHVYLSYSQANHVLNYYVADNTTGVAKPLVFRKFDGANFYNGSSAEWIDERPTINGRPTHLKNFETVTWTHARAEEGSGKWPKVSALPHRRLHMKYRGGEQFAAPGYLNSNGSGFTDNWFHCSVE